MKARTAMLGRLGIVLALAGGLGFSLAMTAEGGSPSAPAPKAAETASYAVPADDGYGSTACLAEGGRCGADIARSWCEAHGHAGDASFNRGDDGYVVVDCRA